MSKINRIKKAILPCGGWSTRFLPTVKAYAKQLVPVLAEPQIHFVLKELIGAGIEEVAIVYRPGELSLQKHFAPDAKLEEHLQETGKEKYIESLNFILSKLKTLKFYPQSFNFPHGNGTPLLVTKKFIGNEPFVYVWADDFTLEDSPGSFLMKMMETFFKYDPAIVIGVQEVPWSEVHRYGSIKYLDDPKYLHRVGALFEKVSAEEAPSNMIQGGRFIVSPRLLPVLEKIPVRKGELWLTDVNNTLAQTDVVLTENYQENHGFWMTTGDPLHWLQVNLAVAQKDPQIYPALKGFLKTIKF